jgi:hypothetical protein
MKHTFGLAAVVALILGATQARGQSVLFDFQDGTDQGFGAGFGNDASKSFSIINIGGSLRMAVPLTGAFQEASRQSQGSDAFLAAMNAATLNPSGYTISYDWYVDTSLSPGNYGTFLQLGTYINAGSGAYAQDFPGSGKDVELNGAQLASGQVFSGTVTETLTQKYGALDPGFLGQSFMRLGLIENGDGSAATVYFDNISIAPVPEPASLTLFGLGMAGLMMIRRRNS